MGTASKEKFWNLGGSRMTPPPPPPHRPTLKEITIYAIWGYPEVISDKVCVSSPLLSEWWQQNCIWAFQSAKDDVRTHKHARTHTHTCMLTHTHTHACSHTHTHARSHTHTHVCTPTLSLSHEHTHMLTHTHTHTSTHAHKHILTHTQTRTHQRKAPPEVLLSYAWVQAPKQKLHPRCIMPNHTHKVWHLLMTSLHQWMYPCLESQSCELLPFYVPSSCALKRSSPSHLLLWGAGLHSFGWSLMSHLCDQQSIGVPYDGWCTDGGSVLPWNSENQKTPVYVICKIEDLFNLCVSACVCVLVYVCVCTCRCVSEHMQACVCMCVRIRVCVCLTHCASYSVHVVWCVFMSTVILQSKVQTNWPGFPWESQGGCQGKTETTK